MSDDVEPHDEIHAKEGYALLEWNRGFGRGVGPLYRSKGDGGRTMAFRVEEHHTNGMLNAHGGMLMTFADMAWGHIVSVETSSFWVTVRLTCDFLSSAKLGEWVEGGAELLSTREGLFTVRGRIWCGERTLVTGTGVFKALGKRPPREGEKAFAAAKA